MLNVCIKLFYNIFWSAISILNLKMESNLKNGMQTYTFFDKVKQFTRIYLIPNKKRIMWINHIKCFLSNSASMLNNFFLGHFI